MEIGIFFILILICALYLWHSVDFMLSKGPNRVVNTNSNLKTCLPIIRDIIKRYNISPNTTTYLEPGAGYGLIGQALSQEFYWKNPTALEISSSTYTVGFIINKISHSRIHYIHENIFEYSFPKNAFIYCYISTAMINRLYQEGKFDTSLVISLTFEISNIKPTERIAIPGWQKQILVYDFR